MKKLTILTSVGAILNLNILAMESIELNNCNSHTKQSVDYKKAWTRSHSILRNHIRNAKESETNYEKTLNIINKAYLNVDACDYDGDTLLFAAARLKDPRILMALLDKNPKNIDATNENGFTVFSLFMSKCYKENYSDFRKRKQLESEKTFNSPPKLKSGLDNSMSTSLAEYDRKEKLDIFSLFREELFYGFSEHDKKNKMDIFSFFEERLSYESSVSSVVEKFIERKADISTKNPINELTPLHYAVRHNDIDTVRLMLDYDSSFIDDLNDLNLSALDYAIKNKNIPIIELLMGKGARVDFEHLKCALEEPELLKALLPNKDSLSKIENGEKILKYYPIYDLNEEALCFLIDQGASVDVLNSHGYSFLTEFIYRYRGSNEKLIDKVIESSDNLDSFDCADWRFKYINPLISEKLVKAKANLEFKN